MVLCLFAYFGTCFYFPLFIPIGNCIFIYIVLYSAYLESLSISYAIGQFKNFEKINMFKTTDADKHVLQPWYSLDLKIGR